MDGKKIKIGMVEDHQLFLKSLKLLLESLPHFEVVVEAKHGADLIEKIKTLTVLPEILLIDVEMPVMNGLETARWIKKNYPSIRPIALSMNDNEQTVIEMIKAGCRTYLLKDIPPVEFENALLQVHENNYYNSDLHSKSLGHLIVNNQSISSATLSNREMEFIQLAASELTYKEIATTMSVSERTVDGYRASIFEKLGVQSRTGMVMEAIRKGWVKV